MKKKLLKLSFILFAFYACENHEEEINPIQKENQSEFQLEKTPVKKIDTIQYKGLTVRHRFNTPFTTPKINSTNKTHSSKTNSTLNVSNLVYDNSYTDDEIISILENRINEFPYSENNEANFEMVKQDFIDLSEEEIAENIEIIEEYYAENIDFVVLSKDQNLIPKTSRIARTSITNNDNYDEIKKLACLTNKYKKNSNILSFVLGLKALKDSRKAKEDAKNSTFGYLNPQNSQHDAFRHVIWSAYLAKYYYTISSKKPRLEFAEIIGNLNESCNENNVVDSEQMDFHNNQIGRKLFNDNTRYKKFLGANIGLKIPDSDRIKQLAQEHVSSGKFIRKNSTSQVKNDIINTNGNTVVYFYRPPYLLKTATAQSLTDSNYEFELGDYNKDGIPDLYAIKKQNKVNNFTQVFILNGADNYKSYLLKASTIQPKTDDNYEFELGDYNKDGIPDLYAIKKQNKVNNFTQVFILNGADNYKSYLLKTSTIQPKTDDNYKFQLGDYNRDGIPDLYAIKKQNRVNNFTQVFILNGANNYKSYLLKTSTIQPKTDDNYEFQLGDYNRDGKPDLYAIKKQNRVNNFTEIFVINGANNYQSYLLKTATVQAKTDDNYEFELGDYNGDKIPNLYAIKKQNTGSNKTEVYILN